jgi:predicted PurR-regulated permease PerM
LEGPQVRKLGFLALFTCLFVLVARLFYPFLSILLWSGLIYIILRKPYARASTRRDGSERKEPTKTLIAGGFALGSILLVVASTALLGTAIIKQLGELAVAVMRTLERSARLIDLSPNGALGGLIYSLSDGQADLSRIDLVADAKSLLVEQRSQIIHFSGTILKDGAKALVGLAFMAFTLYFFFVDGAHLTRTFISAMPIEKDYTSTFLRKLRDSGKQLLIGYFLVALFQSTMLFLICLVMGVKGPLVLATLALIAAFVPMIGTGLVWIPAAVGIALGGHPQKAILFFILSATLVGTLDDFIRPILLRERPKIHPLLLFLSILGGLQIFGFNGIVIGPLILLLFFSSIELYEQANESRAESTSAGTLEE